MTYCGIKDFWEEIQDTANSIKSFYNKTKTLRWFMAIVLCVLYGARMTQGSIFVDSEIMMTDPQMMLKSWCGIGRFGLVLTSRLLAIGRLVPLLAGVLTTMILWGTAFFMSYCLYDWSGKRDVYRKGACVFSLVFVSAPCFAEQFLFLLQAVQVALAMLFCVAAVYCAGQRIYKKKSILWFVPAFGLFVWALGTYQAFAPFFISWTAISFITVYLSEKESCGLRESCSFILLFMVGFITYYVVASFVSKYSSHSSAYIESMFLWGKQSFSQSMEIIKIDFDRIYMGLWSVFFKRVFGIALIAATILGIICGIVQKAPVKRNIVWLICAWLMMDLSPIFLTIATAMNQPIRGQLTYPLACAYVIMFLYIGVCMLKETSEDNFGGRKVKVALECLCVVALCFGYCFGWKQSVTMCQLWETANEGYVQDVLMANRIYSQVCEKRTANTKKVAFIGKQGLSFSDSMVLGDVIGYSYFQWDSESEIGITKRVTDFMKVLGMNLDQVSKEEYDAVLKSSGDKPAWPDAGSVYLENGIVCVKLSDS